METKYKHLHLIDGKIQQSELIHPLNNKDINNLVNKEFFIKTLQKDLGNECSYLDISGGQNNLFKCSIKNEEFNIFIEHTDAGGKDISFNKPDQKVGIPFATKSFLNLIKSHKNVLVVDIYFELIKTNDGNFEINKNKYCYLIVIPSEIYTSKVAYNILHNADKPNQSSRWVTLQNISDCIETGLTLVNKKQNVWLVNPTNIKDFMLGVVLDDYKDQLQKSLDKLLETVHKNKTTEQMIKERQIQYLRRKLRENILPRGKCEILSCKCTIKECLVASHIWPVNDILNSTDLTWEQQKQHVGNPKNAFLLCGTHDKLLDKFLVSFDNNGILIPSKLLSSTIGSYNFGDLSKPVIKISKENIYYLNKHRQLFNKHEQNRILIK